jgi:hypothetical protein
MSWNSSFDYKPNFDTGSPIPGDKFPGIEKNPGIDWGDAFNTKLPSSLTNYKRKNEWGEVFEGLFDKTKNTDKYRDDAKRASFGEAIRGSGGQILENLGTLYPQQHSPMFIPGETSQGVGGALGTLAGIGASFIPGLGPGIAAAMPAIGGSIGSMF